MTRAKLSLLEIVSISLLLCCIALVGTPEEAIADEPVVPPICEQAAALLGNDSSQGVIRYDAETSTSTIPYQHALLTTQSGSSEASEVALYDAATQENRGTLLTTYAGKKTVVIVGRAGCRMTLESVQRAAKISQSPYFADIEFVVLDCDGSGAAFANAYAEYASSTLNLYSLEGSHGYNAWAWENLGHGGTIYLPFVYCLDESGTILDKCTGLTNYPAIIFDTYGVDDPDYQTFEFDAVGEAHQSEARKLLGLVNAARLEAGKPALIWDEALEQTAIQRAMEVYTYYSHDRPDGSSCSSAWPRPYSLARENIAGGGADAQSINDQWTKSSGHYANMVADDVTTFAAACVRACVQNGSYWWVECFSDGIGTGVKTTPIDETIIRAVRANMITLPPSLSLEFYIGNGWDWKMTVGDTFTLPRVFLTYIYHGYTALDAKTLDWQSSDTSVATVSADGVVTAHRIGTATISASFRGRGAPAAYVVVKTMGDVEHADISGLQNETFTGNAIAPSLKVTYNGDELIQDVDYSVNFSDNVNSGVATVTILGIGAYEGSRTMTFTIAKAPSTIKLASQARTYTGKAIAYSGKVTRKGSAGKVSYRYYSDKACKKAVKAADVRAAGTYYVRATVAADVNHEAATSAAVKLAVKKAANPMAVKAVARTAKLATVKKRAATVAAPVSFSRKAQGKVAYAKASGPAALTVDRSTGKVTVRKGTKKGTYTIKVKVTAAGNANYEKLTKTVTCKVVVK